MSDDLPESGDALSELFTAEAADHTPGDGRAAISAQVAGRRRAAKVRSTALVSAVVAAIAVVSVIVTRSGGHSPQLVRTTGIGPGVSVPAGEDVAALTDDGSLVELSPTGAALRQIASPRAVRRCYSPEPSQGCSLITGQPVYQSSLAYDRATRAVLVSLALTGEIDAFPLDGSAPYFVAYGQEPEVSPDGRSLAYTTGEAQLARGTIDVKDLGTGQVTTWDLSAVDTARSMALPDAATAEDSGIATVSWSADNRHLAATFYISFGLNAGNSLGTTFDEVIDLNTTEPVSATNPRVIGPAAATMTQLRSPSDGKGWAHAAWLGDTDHLLVYDPESGTLNATPIRLEIIDAATGTVTSTATLDQPPDAVTGHFPQVMGPGTIFDIDPTGQAALLLGSGAPHLEIWDPGPGSRYKIISDNVASAAWISTTTIIRRPTPP